MFNGFSERYKEKVETPSYGRKTMGQNKNPED